MRQFGYKNMNIKNGIARRWDWYRDEEEIMGYRDVLNTIHEDYE